MFDQVAPQLAIRLPARTSSKSVGVLCLARQLQQNSDSCSPMRCDVVKTSRTPQYEIGVATSRLTVACRSCA